MMSVALAAVAHEQGADVFGINASDNQMIHARISPKSQTPMTPLTPLGGTFNGAPVAAAGARLLDRTKDIVVDVLALGTDNQIYHRTSINGSWNPPQPWSAVPGAWLRTPAAASMYTANYDNDHRDLVGVGLDNGLYWISAAGNIWSTPADTALGGAFVTSPAVVQASGLDLAFFAADVDNRMRARARRENGVQVTWYPPNGDWFSLGGGIFTSAPAVTVDDSAVCDVLALGTENQVYHLRWRAPAFGNALPADWYGLGGSFNSPPAAVRMTQTMKSSTGFLHVFAVDDHNQLRHKCLTPSAWLPSRNDWQIIGGPFNSAPAVATYGDRIWVFGLDPDNHLREMSWKDTDEALPSTLAWEDLGGAFNPEP